MIRLMSILVIIFILYYNSNNISFELMVLLPFSIDKITYLHELDKKVEIHTCESKEYPFYFFENHKLSDWIQLLDHNENYVVTMELIPDSDSHKFEDPQLFISKPFLINHHSSITTISKFMAERVSHAIRYYDLDDFIFTEKVDGITPVVILRYVKIKI